MSVHTPSTTGARTNGRQARRRRPTTSLRLPAAAGAVFFALTIVYAQLRAGAPTAADPAREVVSYVGRHQDDLQLGAVAIAFAMPAALVWLAGLVHLLRQVEGQRAVAAVAALGGGILAAASTVTTALVQGTTAVRFADLGASGTRVGWTMVLLSTGGTLLGLMVVIGATAAVSLRTQLFARWFTMASIALVLLSLVGAFAVGYGSEAIRIASGVAVVVDSVWILVVSFFMWRNPERGRR
jgi:hypothetical protein